jgi:hypothetical protein
MLRLPIRRMNMPVRELWRKRGDYTHYWVNKRDKVSPYIYSNDLSKLWLARFLKLLKNNNQIKHFLKS